MKVISVKCPNCSANLQVDSAREFTFCAYCGAKILIYNENEHIVRHIDEARLKEAEVRLKELEIEENRRREEKQQKEAEERRKRLELEEARRKSEEQLRETEELLKKYQMEETRMQSEARMKEAELRAKESELQRQVQTKRGSNNNKTNSLLLVFILCFASMFFLCGMCGLYGASDRKDKNSTISSGETVLNYDVKLTVDFSPNLILAKYTVWVLLDDEKIAELKHGQDLDKTFSVAEGKHTLKFQKEYDSSVNGEKEIEITGPTQLDYKIISHGDYIEIEDLRTSQEESTEESLGEDQIRISKSEYDLMGQDYHGVETFLRSEGFQNITSVPTYDIVFGITPKESVARVQINGLDSFHKNDVYHKDDPVTIVYHMPYDQDPEYNKSTEPMESIDISGRAQKNGYEEDKTVSEKVGKFTFLVPSYWDVDETNDDTYRAYAERDGKVAMLMIMSAKDEEDPVNYDVLKEATDNGKMAEAILTFGENGEVTSTEEYDNGRIKGFIYHFSVNVNNKIPAHGSVLCFPSESDSSWEYYNLIVSDNAEFSYDDDFRKILDSISEDM